MRFLKKLEPLLQVLHHLARPIEDLTTLSATAFLGISIECSRCHDHPFGVWKRDDFIGLLKDLPPAG